MSNDEKMNEFDIVFKGQHGTFTVNQAKKWPTKEDLEEELTNLEEIGIGKVTEIIIKPLK